MRARTFITVALTLAAALTAVQQTAAQQYLTAGINTQIRDVTADGSLIVGNGPGGAFYWDWRNDPTPTYIGGLTAKGVSADGTWIVGSITDPIENDTVAARWSVATGWESLGWLPNALSCPGLSSASDISADGSTIVGLSWDGCSARGFIWTELGGMQELQVVGTGQNNARTLSGDGSTVGGNGNGLIGSSPAVWQTANLNGNLIDANDQGHILGLSHDGAIRVGRKYFSGGTLTAFVGDDIGGDINLGSEHPSSAGWAAEAQAISFDSSVIVGRDFLGLASEAWVWRAGEGIISLNDRLVALGIGGIPLITSCEAVSADGKVVVGIATDGTSSFPSTGFVAELVPQDLVWTDLGGDTNGINGHPHLSGTGTLVSGTPTTIDLVNGPNSAISVVWTSLASVPFNVAGGTIYANPYVSEILIPLNGSGEFHAAFPWFAGVPSGLSLHFQFLIQDLSRVYGFSISNGLKATAP